MSDPHAAEPGDEWNPNGDGKEALLVSSATVESPSIKEYGTLQQVADALNYSANTVKGWDKEDLLPAPDALFVGVSHTRAWDVDRVVALVVKDTPDEIKGRYEWNQTPVVFLTTAGIAQLLRVSPNTVKWWVLDEERRRTRFGFGEGKPQLIALPQPDARSGWNTGWTVESIWNWWNNEYPRQIGDTNKRRSVSFHSLFDRGRTVAVVEDVTAAKGDAAPLGSVQIRPGRGTNERVSYISAETVLQAANSHSKLGDSGGCWFIPDLADLDDLDQQTVLRYLVDREYPAVVAHRTAVSVPDDLWDSHINIVSATDFETIAEQS